MAMSHLASGWYGDLKDNIAPVGIANPPGSNACFKIATMQAMLCLTRFREYLQGERECTCPLSAARGVQLSRCPLFALERLAVACEPVPVGPSFQSRLKGPMGVAEAEFRRMLAVSASCSLGALKLGCSELEPPSEWAMDDEQHDGHAVFLTVADHLSVFGRPSGDARNLFSVGVLRRMTCTRCGAQRDAPTVDETGLTVPLHHALTPPSSSLSSYPKVDIADLIEGEYTQETLLTAHCDGRCAIDTPHSMETLVTHRPKYLAVHLQRYRRGDDGVYAKDHTRVALSEFLDASKVLRLDASADPFHPHYRLRSVVMHAGGLEAGHFRVRCFNVCEVVDMDDDQVVRTSVRDGDSDGVASCAADAVTALAYPTYGDGDSEEFTPYIAFYASQEAVS